MTMTSEELRIKIKVDTQGVEQSAAKVKSSLRGIEDSASGVSGATAGATASLEELQGTMKLLVGLEFAEVFQQYRESISGFTDSVKKNVKRLNLDLSHLPTVLKSIASPKYRAEEMGWTTWEESVKGIKKEFKVLGNDIKKFAKNTSSALKGLWNDTRNLRIAFVGLATALVPIAGIMSSFSASAMGKEIYNTAQRVGMSTAKYQEWKYIIEQTGGDITDLIGAQQTLTEAQIDVAEGSEEIIDAFKRIGLSSEEVLNMDRQELFERTIAGLQNIENTTERAAVGYRLLSEDASTLAALLGMTNEETRQLADNYQYLGAIMSEELLAKSLRFQGSLAQLRAAFQGLTNTLAEIFLPVITAVVNGLTKAIAVVNMFLRTLFGLELTTSESGTNSAVGSGINGFGGLKDSIEEADGAAKELRRTLMGFDELNVLDGTTGSSSSGGSSGGVGDVGGSIGGGSLNNVGGGLFNPENLGLDKWKEQIEKWKGIIQTVVPIAMIGFGAVGAVWFLLKGNWVAALACLTMAGIGFAAADSSGLWEKMRDWFEKYNLQIIPIALVGIGAVGAVFFAMRGNWVGAMAMATMAGISLMALSGGDGFSLEEIKTIKEELKNYAIPLIALTGAIAMGLRGNLVAAAALLAVAGITGVLTHVGEGSLWDGMLNVFGPLMPTLKTYAIPLIALAGAIGAALTGNFIAAGILLGVAGLSGAVIFGNEKGAWDDLIKSIKEAWNNIKAWFNANVKPIFTKEWWSKLFSTIGAGLSAKIGEARATIINGWNNIKSYFNTNIKPKFTAAYWQTIFDNIRAGIATKLGDIRTQIINSWNNIREYFNANIKPKFTKQYWLNIYETFRVALGEKLTAAKTTVINAWNQIKTYFNTNIKPKFTKSYWQTKFNSIKDGAKAALNGVISIVETAINSIVKKLNTVKFSIPGWVPGVGGKSFGIKLSQVKIPRLAEGGIAVSSTLANIGENGREAVLPLDNNTQWMDALADKIASRSQGPTKLVLKVGEKELGWASIKGINQITRQTGELQLVL